MTTDSTRDRLIQSAADLFRQRGYDGVGVAEILTAAKAPKGSLYHHFPNGKADLARAAAEYTADQMLRVIDEAFDGKADWPSGAAHYTAKLAKLFDSMDAANNCPVQAMLFDGPKEAPFRNMAGRIFASWQSRLTEHGVRLGLTPDDAGDKAETLLIAIEGAWTLARARRDSAVLKTLPARLYA